MTRSPSAATSLLVVLLGLAVALPFVAPGYYVQFASKAVLMAMLALSLNLVVGYGGMVSMCHAAFFGLSGYMLGFMTADDAGASVWLALPAAVLVVAAVAAIIGALSLRPAACPVGVGGLPLSECAWFDVQLADSSWRNASGVALSGDSKSLLLTVACSARPTEPQPRPGPHNAPRPVAGAAPAAPAH
jgi:ABC-type branched-subunit amino acid transport system permease subunit